MNPNTPTNLCTNCKNKCREEDSGYGPPDGACRVFHEVPEQLVVKEAGFCCPHAQVTNRAAHTDGCEEMP